MGPSMCHDSDETSMDCCAVRSAPEPMPALALETSQLPEALEVTDLRVVTPPSALPPHSAPADAFLLHDLGRYTLFSSFLL